MNLTRSPIFWFALGVFGYHFWLKRKGIVSGWNPLSPELAA